MTASNAVTDAEVEAAARALWDVWRASRIAKPMYREIEWDWMVRKGPQSAAGAFVEIGRAEARAALEAAARLRASSPE